MKRMSYTPAPGSLMRLNRFNITKSQFQDNLYKTPTNKKISNKPNYMKPL